MIEEIFEIADAIAELLPDNQKDVIHTFKESLSNNSLHVARIISDELSDYFADSKTNSELTRLSSKLYDKTMEYFEINY